MKKKIQFDSVIMHEKNDVPFLPSKNNINTLYIIVTLTLTSLKSKIMNEMGKSKK